MLWNVWQPQEMVAGMPIGPSSFMEDHFLVSLNAVLSLRVWTLITSCFSHQDFNHFLFNMFAFYVFGRSVGEVVGSRGLVHVYLVGGLLASLGHVAFQIITGSNVPALGASGSVMAFAVVYGATFPKRKLYLYFAIPVPAIILVVGFVVMDLMGVLGVGKSNIAHAAHLGGAFYGLAYWAFVVRRRLKGRPPP